MDGRLDDAVRYETVRNAMARRNLPLVVTVSWIGSVAVMFLGKPGKSVHLQQLS